MSRYRGILLGGGAAGLAKFITLLTVAFSVPMTVQYLGSERYGLWMTISSFLAALSFTDLGIGNGLVAELASADGKRDHRKMAGLVSSAFYMLVGVGGTLAIICLSAYPLAPWPKLLGVTAPLAMEEAGPAILTFTLCFAASLPLTVVQRVQVGLQESWRANLWQAAASTAALIAVILAALNQAGVVTLILAMNGVPLVVGAINSIVEFRSRRPALRPRVGSCDSVVVRKLFGSGGIFFMLQLCVLVGTAGDSIILAQLFGPTAVSDYSVVHKIFQVTLILNLFLQPLWPALGEALARGDHAWARRALNRASLISTVCGGLLGLMLIMFGGRLIHMWVGDVVQPGLSMIAAFSLWTVLAAYGGAITTLLNNAQFLKVQLKVYGLASLFALALKFPLAHWVGPAGVVWATVIAYSVGYCLPAAIIARRFFRSAGVPP